jgi:hypothetical protein
VHSLVKLILTKLPVLGSQISVKFRCISVEQVNILDVGLYTETIAGLDQAFINKHSLEEHPCNH